MIIDTFTSTNSQMDTFTHLSVRTARESFEPQRVTIVYVEIRRNRVKLWERSSPKNTEYSLR